MAYLIQEDDIYGAWRKLLVFLITAGDRRSPRGLETREFLGVEVQVRKGRANIIYDSIRNLNLKFMVAEWFWILSGSDDLETIAKYNSHLLSFSDDGIKLRGAYGPRLIPQLPWLLEKLKDCDTRQGVVSIWTPTPEPSKDIPCTVALQFLRRDNQINLIVTMRSSDAWLGLPYDFFVFSQILNCVCGELACEVGWVQFNLGSSHLYEIDVDQAKALLSIVPGRAIFSPKLPGLPPEWLKEAFVTHKFPEEYWGDRREWIWGQYLLVLNNSRNMAIDFLGQSFT